jgi:hypothetical protein
MTAYSQALAPPTLWSLATQRQTGSSDEAKRVDRDLGKSIEHYLGPRWEQLFFPIAAVLGSSQSEDIPVSIATAVRAMDFAQALPRTIPIPEISADPDGEIAFDWVASSGRMFSVSVSDSGRLSYAGYFGENSRIHGTENLGEAVPFEVLRGIQRATR